MIRDLLALIAACAFLFLVAWLGQQAKARTTAPRQTAFCLHEDAGLWFPCRWIDAEEVSL